MKQPLYLRRTMLARKLLDAWNAERTQRADDRAAAGRAQRRAGRIGRVLDATQDRRGARWPGTKPGAEGGDWRMWKLPEGDRAPELEPGRLAMGREGYGEADE